jgi:hypothetical protein
MSERNLLIGAKDGVVHFGGYRWWAERGLIHWEHKETGDYGTSPVRVVLTRLSRVNEMVHNVRTGDKDPEKGEAALEAAFGGDSSVHADYIDDMIELCRKAKEQGDPEEEDTARDLKRRRAKTTIVPGLKAAF